MENSTDGRWAGGRENGGERRKGSRRLRIGQIRIDIDILTGEREVMNIDITIVEKRVMATENDILLRKREENIVGRRDWKRIIV